MSIIIVLKLSLLLYFGHINVMLDAVVFYLLFLDFRTKMASLFLFYVFSVQNLIEKSNSILKKCLQTPYLTVM